MPKSPQAPEEATLLADLRRYGVDVRRRLAHEASELWDDERQLPAGMPSWWVEYLRTLPSATRKQTHALAILYCGQTYKELRQATGLSTVSIAKRLKHPAFRRFLASIGTADTEGEVIATKDVVREYWTSVLADDSLPHSLRIKAGDLIMKSLGGYTTKVEHSGGVSLGDLLRDLRGDTDADEAEEGGDDDPFG